MQPVSGISYHRLVNPFSYLDMGPDVELEMLFFGEDEHKIDCDILYYSKFLNTDPKFLKLLKDKGTKIVVDIDDHWVLPENHPNYIQWNANKMSEKIVENLKIADLVICTTMKLQEAVREHCKNTVVIPNAFPVGEECYMPVEKELCDKMKFIYVAGSTHLPDCKLLDGKFKRIGSDPSIKNKAEFILAGYEQTKKRRYLTKADMVAKNNNFVEEDSWGIWEKMRTIFKQTGSWSVQNSLSLDDYMNHYDNADVSIIPLVNTTWNSYKSTLKIVESGFKGLMTICSDVQPYNNLKPCEGIWWIDNKNQWGEAIKYCVKNPEYVKDQGKKLYEWITKEYDLFQWNAVRKQVLLNLVKC